MSNFISKALLAIALDKKAREALKQSRAAEKAGKAPATAPPPTAAAPAAKARPALPAPAANVPAPAAARSAAAAASPKDLAERLDKADKSDRRALIRNAIKVRRDKMAVLEDLSEDQRRELQIHALRAIIERSKGGGNGA